MALPLHDRRVAFGHIVTDRQLRLSPYARMNDPFENKNLALSYGGYEADGHNLGEQYWHVYGVINRVRGGMRVLSMTTDADEWGAPFGGPSGPGRGPSVRVRGLQTAACRPSCASLSVSASLPLNDQSPAGNRAR